MSVAIDAIRSGEAPTAQRVFKCVGVFCAHHDKHSLNRIGIGSADRNTLESNLGVTRLSKRKLRHHRTKTRFANRQLHIGTAFYLDAFSANLKSSPLAIPTILTRMFRRGFEAEKVSLIGAQGGQSPGD